MDVVVGIGMDAMRAAHDGLGAPWGVSIALASIAARCMLLPVTVRSMQASNTLARVSALARSIAADDARRRGARNTQLARLAMMRAEVGTPTSTKAGGDAEAFISSTCTSSKVTASLDDEKYRNTGVLSQLRRAYAAHMHMCRAEAKRAMDENDTNNSRDARAVPIFAHPAWLLASPLTHVPALVCGLAAARRLALEPPPGLREGGALWFTDLTLPAIEGTLASGYACPMGIIGGVLPALNAAMYMYNVQTSFATPSSSSSSSSTKPPAVVVVLRLILEWLTLPVLVASMHMPHSVVIYWTSSTAFNTVVLGHIFRTQSVRQALGVGITAQSASTSTSASAAEPEVDADDLDDRKGAQRLRLSRVSYAELMDEAQALTKVNRWEDAANIFLTAAERQMTAAQAGTSSRGGGGGGEGDAMSGRTSGGKPNLKQKHMQRQKRVVEHQDALFRAGVAFHKAGHANVALQTLLLLDSQLGREQHGGSGGGVMRGRALGKDGSDSAVLSPSSSTAPSANVHFVPTQLALAQILKEANRRQEAIACLRKASAVDPDIHDKFLRPLLESHALK